MKVDSIIKEVRAARKKIEQECAQRGEPLGDYLIRIRVEFKDRLVDRSSTIDKPEKTKIKSKTKKI